MHFSVFKRCSAVKIAETGIAYDFALEVFPQEQSNMHIISAKRTSKYFFIFFSSFILVCLIIVQMFTKVNSKLLYLV